jgi:hypothetical protein
MRREGMSHTCTCGAAGEPTRTIEIRRAYRQGTLQVWSFEVVKMRPRTPPTPQKMEVMGSACSFHVCSGRTEVSSVLDASSSSKMLHPT